VENCTLGVGPQFVVVGSAAVVTHGPPWPIVFFVVT